MIICCQRIDVQTLQTLTFVGTIECLNAPIDRRVHRYVLYATASRESTTMASRAYSYISPLSRHILKLAQTSCLHHFLAFLAVLRPQKDHGFCSLAQEKAKTGHPKPRLHKHSPRPFNHRSLLSSTFPTTTSIRPPRLLLPVICCMKITC